MNYSYNFCKHIQRSFGLYQYHYRGVVGFVSHREMAISPQRESPLRNCLNARYHRAYSQCQQKYSVISVDRRPFVCSSRVQKCSVSSVVFVRGDLSHAVPIDILIHPQKVKTRCLPRLQQSVRQVNGCLKEAVEGRSGHKGLSLYLPRVLSSLMSRSMQRYVLRSLHLYYHLLM